MIIKILKKWLPIAFICTVFALTVDVAIQQNYRQSANDPQIQLAEDDAVLLSQGASTESFDTKNKIDIASSLSPFVIIYNDSYNSEPIASSAILDGTIPQAYVGSLATARYFGENRITWEPKNGVRIAAVIKHFTNKTTGASGYVLGGRNLREVEKRETNLTYLVGLGWLASTFGSLLLISLLEFLTPNKK